MNDNFEKTEDFDCDQEEIKDREMRVSGVPKNIKRTIKNIADNLGTTSSNLVKAYLPDLIEKYPERYRNAPVKD